MDGPALGQRHGLVTVRLGTEKGSDLIKDTAETGGGGEGFEPAHRPVALLDALMVLLQVVVEMAVGAVQHPVPKDVSNGVWIGIMPIGGDAVRRHSRHRPGGAEERLSRLEVTPVAEPCIDAMAVAINRPVEVLPLALDFDTRLVDIPAFAHGTVAPPAQGLTEERSELAFPLPHRFMRKHETPLEEHFRQVPRLNL
jgi:hypothetical protein